jgi:DNA repair exonuclease SbcCD ATPase subunit
VGAEERHKGVVVSPLLVRVVPPDPAQAAAAAEAAAEQTAETQRMADERATEIENALAEIQLEVKETEALAKKRKWLEARERLAKLGELFAPLDAPAIAGAAPGALPPEVGKVRARYEVLHEKMQAFEAEVFEATFSDVTAVSNKAVAEERILERIAKRFKITTDYVQTIYTDRAEEIQRRIEDRARAHLDKVKAEQQAREQRCGTLPTGAYKTVETYLKEALTAPRVQIVLGECLTPRLTESACWEVQCDYQRKEEVAIERPKVVTKHQVTVHLVHGRVTGHR